MKKHSTRASELETALMRESGQALETVRKQGMVLEIAARLVQEVLEESSRYQSSAELRARAWRVRGGVRQAAAIVLEIEAAAGIIEGLAEARQYLADDLAATG